MKVVFSKTLLKKENVEKHKEKIVKAYAKGIFTIIKGKDLPRDSQLVKIYTTTISGVGRLVFLIQTKTDDGFFLFFRSKNDEIGQNISIKNPKFRSQLRKYLQILKEDIKKKNYEVYKISGYR
ncbi:MAG: hypothetical protein Q8P68_00080 [Candidatus Peregrinibacteria bacterium]|nr:hypothetical protein [Candidatus Peregrinibacteria bacterium]MDZ4244911.1 hypothetical protein [Candidatus Gracilibacteria bacterium]